MPLEILDISNNSFEREGAEALAEFLKTEAKQLRELKMQMNECGELGCSAVARALKGNTTLQLLDIGGCGLGPSGAKVLAESIKGHPELSTLTVRREVLRTLPLVVSSLFPIRCFHVVCMYYQASLSERIPRLPLRTA